MSTDSPGRISPRGSWVLLIVNSLAVFVLLVLLLPQKFGPSDTADAQVVVVCAVLGFLLLIESYLGLRWWILQCLVPALVLLVIYGTRLSKRGAIADMWALTLVYPVLPAVLGFVWIFPWIGRKARKRNHPERIP
jgi:hypothetical protein